MKIIACLGNPGKKYISHRHNAGFILGRYIAEEFCISVKKKMFSSLCGSGKIDGADVLILFPQTFMNKSGIAVSSAMCYYGSNPGDIIVVHDEIELPFGELRTKFGGGHKGQNGIRSIIEATGSPDFHRLRFGVGRPVNQDASVADYVLSDFSHDEILLIKEIAPAAVGRIREIVEKISSSSE